MIEGPEITGPTRRVRPQSDGGLKINRKVAMDDETYKAVSLRARECGLSISAHIRGLIWDDWRQSTS